MDFLEDGRQVEIGFTLAPAAQGRGLGAEAVIGVLDFLFARLGKHRAFASVDPRNEPSLRLLQRVGMRQEAHFRRSLLFKGEWADDLVFAVLRSEWTDVRPGQVGDGGRSPDAGSAPLCGANEGASGSGGLVKTMADNEQAIAGLAERVSKLEMQMGYLLRQMGISTQEAPAWTASPQVIDLVVKGMKNEAIRTFREESGASLKDAKTFIESLAPRLASMR